MLENQDIKAYRGTKLLTLAVDEGKWEPSLCGCPCPQRGVGAHSHFDCGSEGKISQLPYCELNRDNLVYVTMRHGKYIKKNLITLSLLIAGLSPDIFTLVQMAISTTYEPHINYIYIKTPLQLFLHY